MAGTVQSVQVGTDAGITPTDIHGALATTNEAPVNARLLMFITATSGGCTVTLKNQVTVDGQQAPDRVITIPASSTRIIGPIPAGVYALGDSNFEFDINTPANVATCYLVEVP